MAFARYSFVLQDALGAIVNGATVEVRAEAPGAPLATLYSDRAGAVPLGNSFVAADGSDVFFHVLGGVYKITATVGGFTQIRRYVGIGLASESDLTFDDMVPLAGGVQLTGAVDPKAFTNIASAATCNIGGVTSNQVNVTGVTAITSFGIIAAGVQRLVKFAGILTLTYNAADLILPGGANIVTAANDTAMFTSLGGGSWICDWYKRQTGKGVINPAYGDITGGAADKGLYFAAAGAPTLFDLTAAGRALAGGVRGADIFKILAADDGGGGNVNTAQPWFPTAGAVAVAADTTYVFEGLLFTTRAAGANSHTTGLLFGGTATLTAIDYLAECKTGDTNALAAPNTIWGNAAAEVVVKAASTATTENTLIRVKGIVRINAGGTLIPQFKYSVAPGGAPTIKRGSFFRLFPVGDKTVVAAGTWS